MELEMPHGGTLNCYVSVRGMTACIVYMDEGQVVSEKGRLSTDMSGMLPGRFGDRLRRNAEEYAEGLERIGWKEEGE